MAPPEHGLGSLDQVRGPAAVERPAPVRTVLVVVLNYNGIADTLDCLESLRAQTCPGLATLVIETLYDAGIIKPVIKIGLADSFFECGSQEYLEAKYGVDLPRFVRAIVENR